MTKQLSRTKRGVSAVVGHATDDWFFHRVIPLTILLALVGVYPLLNLPWQPLHSTLSVTDTRIPLIPIFVIPYLFFFFPWLVGLVIWAFIRNVRVFQRVSIALMAGVLLSYACYMLYQTAVVRSAPDGSVFSGLLRWAYRSDVRYNAFPSSHTFVTVILLATTLPLLRRTGTKALAVAVAVLIVLSTLLTKQHHIADVLGGLVIGGLALGLAALIQPIFFEAPRRVTTARATQSRPTRRVRSR